MYDGSKDDVVLIILAIITWTPWTLARDTHCCSARNASDPNGQRCCLSIYAFYELEDNIISYVTFIFRICVAISFGMIICGIIKSLKIYLHQIFYH